MLDYQLKVLGGPVIKMVCAFHTRSLHISGVFIPTENVCGGERGVLTPEFLQLVNPDVLSPLYDIPT